jgi:hypothetical protein
MPERRSLHVIDDFLPEALAGAMRAGIEAHFGTPALHSAECHQVWNYWFVPDGYAYLRSNPEKVFDRGLAEGFMAALSAWSGLHLGLPGVTWPYLSLYIPGCRQGLHNDSANGRFAFVYSLTRNDRRSEGGDTLVYRDQNPFRANLARAAAGRGFYEQVAPRFNRLVVFDDRLPHAVTPVEGSMDPLEGRLVLHGHISEAGPILSGSLVADAVLPPLQQAILEWRQQEDAALAAFHGLLCLRLRIAAGAVQKASVLLDRVTHPQAPGEAAWPALRAALLQRLLGHALPAGTGELVLPLPFG